MAAMSRRQFLAAGGGLTLAGALSACGTPIGTSLTGGQPATADVIFWHLFGGGDGTNMQAMVAKFQETSHRSVEATLLSWGNPYYTKLALSASSGRPPDVAIAHLSRLPLLAQAGLLEPVDTEQFGLVGITEDKFTPAAWSKATVGETVYAVPLDTHPFVLFYNVALAKKAGLLSADGKALKPMKGRDDFVGALKAMKDAGGDFGAVATITADPSTCWRLFTMLYSGLAGPIVSDQGTRVTIDRPAMEETFAFLQSLTGKQALMPRNATATTSSTLFSQGKAGFLFDGEWQIPTYRGVKTADGKALDFNVVPFPAILGPKPVAYADSHSLIIPKSSERSAKRSADAVGFVKGLLDESAIWAGGGHIPAWLSVQKSKEFLEQTPQRNYIRAAFDAVYDPVAWYTGAGSDFQTAMGSSIASVLAGGSSPRQGVEDLTASLQKFSTARPPVE
jgi:multiple sugar transport system substrate-binding protein